MEEELSEDALYRLGISDNIPNEISGQTVISGGIIDGVTLSYDVNSNSYVGANQSYELENITNRLDRMDELLIRLENDLISINNSLYASGGLIDEGEKNKERFPTIEGDTMMLELKIKDLEARIKDLENK